MKVSKITSHKDLLFAISKEQILLIDKLLVHNLGIDLIKAIVLEYKYPYIILEIDSLSYIIYAIELNFSYILCNIDDKNFKSLQKLGSSRKTKLFENYQELVKYFAKKH